MVCPRSDSEMVVADAAYFGSLLLPGSRPQKSGMNFLHSKVLPKPLNYSNEAWVQVLFHGMCRGVHVHVPCLKSQLQESEAGLAGYPAPTRLPVFCASYHERREISLCFQASAPSWHMTCLWRGCDRVASALSQGQGAGTITYYTTVVRSRFFCALAL